MKKRNTPHAKSAGKKLAIGVGLAALAAAAAGTYFLYGSKNAGKNRKRVKAWTLKAKGEVLEKLENLKVVDEEIYRKIVKDVAARYQALKKIDTKDVLAFATELNNHWKEIAKKAGTSARRAAKKTSKKVSKK